MIEDFNCTVIKTAKIFYQRSVFLLHSAFLKVKFSNLTTVSLCKKKPINSTFPYLLT